MENLVSGSELLGIGSTGEQSKDRKGAAEPSGGFELIIAAVLQNSGFHPVQSGVVEATRPAVESLEPCPAVTQTVGSLGAGRGVGAAAEGGQQVGEMGRRSNASLSGMSQQGRQVAVQFPGMELPAPNEAQPVQQRGGADRPIGEKPAVAAVTPRQGGGAEQGVHAGNRVGQRDVQGTVVRPRQEVEAEQLRPPQTVVRVAEYRALQPAEYNVVPRAQGEAPRPAMRPGEPAPESQGAREAWQQAAPAPQTPIMQMDATPGDSVRVARAAQPVGNAQDSEPQGTVPGIVESAEGMEKGRVATTKGQPQEMREAADASHRAPQTPIMQMDATPGDSVRVARAAEVPGSQPVGMGPATVVSVEGNAQGVGETADTARQVLVREAEHGPQGTGVTRGQAGPENGTGREVREQAEQLPQTPTSKIEPAVGNSVRVARTAHPLGSEQDSKPVNPAARQAVDASGQEPVRQAQPGAEQLAARAGETASENEPGRENMRKGAQGPQAPLSRPMTEPGNSGQIAHAPTEASTATETAGPRQAGLEEVREPGQVLKAGRPAEGVAERRTQVTSDGAANRSGESTGTEVVAKSEQAASKVRGAQSRPKGSSEKTPQVIVTDLGLGKLAPGGQARLANGPGSTGGIAEAARVAHSGQQRVTSAQYQVTVEVEEGQLGPLRLEVAMDGETVRAVVMTDSVDARELVRSCEPAIRAALVQHNLQVDSFEVEHTATSTRDSAGMGGHSARAGGQPAGAGSGSGGLAREAATVWPSELVSTRNQAEVAREWGSSWKHVGLVDLVA